MNEELFYLFKMIPVSESITMELDKKYFIILPFQVFLLYYHGVRVSSKEILDYLDETVDKISQFLARVMNLMVMLLISKY